MILQALYEYYQRKASDPESNIALPGYEWKEIPFIIVIDKNGKFINLEDTREGGGKQKVAKRFLVIKSKGRSGKNSYLTTNVLWDHYGYVLAHPKDDTDKAKDDANKQHKTFVMMVDELVQARPDNEEFLAIKYFLESEDGKECVFKHESWQNCSKISGCNLSFRIIGKKEIAAEHSDLTYYAEVDKRVIEDDSETVEEPAVSCQGTCLITGEQGQIAVLHHATSVPGGKSGGKLVGFQKNSGYDSYYKEQGLNAPVSKKAEDAYTTALNVLLGKGSQNKFRISDTTIIFWASRKTEFEKKISFFFTNPEKDNPDRNSQEVKALFESIHSGNLNTESETQFYILGLAPNAARISVRFWKTGTVKYFAEKIALHFLDLDIVKPKDEIEYFTLFKLLTSISFDYKIDNLPPSLAAGIITSILDGAIYPATLQQQCIRRIKADRKINRTRAAILKAYLNRKNRIYQTNEKEITMALDLLNINQGYLCGRLFAVLEKIQEEALPGINATIKDRYYGAASSTPVTVFSRLLNLKNHHLAKLNPGRKTNFEKLIQKIMAGINSNGLPAHLTLDDQSRFAVGYYHQRQDLFTSKEQKEL
ncbi:MAG: type I-C CRISPR-associated protein Cas8c/Csd1 [Ignavibacteria bacterium]